MTPAAATRAWSGARARAAGRAFERWIDAEHARALSMGLVSDLRHVSPRVEIVGRGRAVVTGEACADYVGLLPDGRGLVVEAKSTGDGALARSQLEEQQRNQLDAYARAGAVALLVIEFRAAGCARFAVPWADAPWQTRGRGASLHPADLNRFRVAGTPYLAAFVTAEAA